MFFLPCIELFSQETHFNWKGIISEKGGARSIPNATVQVFSEGRQFVFVASDNGEVNIGYYRPTTSDSILTSSIGFKPRKLSCQELYEMKEIQLEEDVYSISEVVITSTKRKKIIRLGNRVPFTFYHKSTNSSYETQQGLLIKYEETYGRIVKVLYYIGNDKNKISGENLNKWSFLLKIYDIDTINYLPNKDLLGIASPSVGGDFKNGWIEIDISRNNIELPRKGVFVGMEIMSEEHFLSRRYYNSYKPPRIGITTRSEKSQPSFESWINNNKTGWKRVLDADFLIYIIVEIKHKNN